MLTFYKGRCWPAWCPWFLLLLKDILAAIKSDVAEKGITTELTLAALHDFFAKKVGRNVAVDGALVNFAGLLPAEVTMEI